MGVPHRTLGVDALIYHVLKNGLHPQVSIISLPEGIAKVLHPVAQRDACRRQISSECWDIIGPHAVWYISASDHGCDCSYTAPCLHQYLRLTNKGSDRHKHGNTP